MIEIKKSKVLSKIAEAAGSNYKVTFIKLNGEKRTMLCRQGVDYNLKGGVNKVSKPSNDNVSTFDVDKFAHRAFSIDRLQRLEVNGVIYKVID